MSAHAFAPNSSESLARRVATGARILMGLIFLAHGLEGLFGSEPSARSTHLLVMISTAELVVGVLLMSKRLVPLALVMSAPIVIDLVISHATAGIGYVSLIVELELYLAWQYRDAFRSLVTSAPALEPALVPVQQPRAPRVPRMPALPAVRSRSWFLA